MSTRRGARLQVIAQRIALVMADAAWLPCKTVMQFGGYDGGCQCKVATFIVFSSKSGRLLRLLCNPKRHVHQ